MEVIVSFIISLVSKYPITASFLMVVGVLRAVFKPIFAVAEAYVASTPNPEDDKVLENVKKSKAYSTLAFLLDYIGSIKLPK